MYNHNALYLELSNFMHEIKEKEKWEEPTVLKNIRNILNKHLGAPPEKFTYNGKEYTPASFFSNVISLPLEQYLIVTSFQYAPFNQFIELKVPDNWKHNTNYFNVPLNLFYSSLIRAITNGYSAAIDLDNSEPSYRMTKQYAFVPEFDVPKDSITQTKREEEFQSGATTDDHLMHIISYKRFNTEDWFLAKDSWRIAWEGSNHGYFFLHESYIKMKVLAYIVHQDGVPEIARLLSN
jgi:bleomycin hydrolase